MKALRPLLCFMSVLLLLAGCSQQLADNGGSTLPQTEKNTSEEIPPEKSTSGEAPSEDNGAEKDLTAALLASMSLREKVGQLFIVCPEALNYGVSKDAAVSSLNDNMRKELENYPCGGIIMFAGNIISPGQIKAFISELQSACKLPLFIGVDEEGGKIARIANNSAFNVPKFESAAAAGAGSGVDAPLAMGRAIGAYLREYGFNIDFAPDADVFTNPRNTVIGDRAFSSDALRAAECADAMAQGLKSEGIISVFKHFPGHGDTEQDSHTETAVTHKTLSQLQTCELIPFERADGCIMAGHIAAPEITGDMTPAVFSEKLINGVLRGNMGFRGAVITDSLSMGAVTDNYTAGEAAAAALKAGCDILLMPENYREAFDAVISAVNKGELSEERLNASVRRVLEMKSSMLKQRGAAQAG